MGKTKEHRQRNIWEEYKMLTGKIYAQKKLAYVIYILQSYKHILLQKDEEQGR